MSDDALLKEVLLATGLPQESLSKEMSRLFEKSNVSGQPVNLDQLRDILAEYLQDVLLEAKAAQDLEISA